MYRLFHFFFVCVLSTVIISCGGAGGSSDTDTSALEGIFTDGPVEGLSYTSGSLSGITNETGRFSYQQGETVTFSVGDIIIGTGTPTATMTPISLVPGAVDETHPTVINIVRFLMTIDDDNDASNGIQITQTVRLSTAAQSIDFSQSTSAFDSNTNVQNVVALLTAETTVGVRYLVSTQAAQEHLAGTLQNIDTGTGTSLSPTGNLTLSGNDTNVIGTSFIPVDDFNSYAQNTQLYSNVYLAMQDVELGEFGTPVDSSVAAIRFLGIDISTTDDTISSIFFGRGTSAGGGSIVHHYILYCFSGDDCSGASFNRSELSISFSNVVLQPVVFPNNLNTNLATGDITLNGTVSVARLPE